MNSIPRNAIIFVLMLLASGLSYALRPHTKLADTGTKVNLESMIPAEFGEWHIDRTIVPLMVNPEVQAKLDKIYNQTLSRTYVNGRGERIMLSIAYGGDQSDSMQLHRPEVCYTAQGFQISKNVAGTLDSSYGDLPVKRLMAKQGSREEPITYWIAIGGQLIITNLQQKVVQLNYGLRGVIPDGFLVRFSSLTPDKDAGYALQKTFITAMLQGMNSRDRARLAALKGDPASAAQEARL